VVEDLKTEDGACCGFIFMFMLFTENTYSKSLFVLSGLDSFCFICWLMRLSGCVEPKGAHANLRELVREFVSYLAEYLDYYLEQGHRSTQNPFFFHSERKMTLVIILLNEYPHKIFSKFV